MGKSYKSPWFQSTNQIFPVLMNPIKKKPKVDPASIAMKWFKGNPNRNPSIFPFKKGGLNQ
jgi:hypothetical protein